MSELTLDRYAQLAGDTAIYPDRGNNLPYAALGLGGEAGEIQNKAKKVIRDNGGRLDAETTGAIAKELGDVLWYVAAVAYEIGVPLSRIAEMNLEKLTSRKERGTLGGSGDNR